MEKEGRGEEGAKEGEGPVMTDVFSLLDPDVRKVLAAQGMMGPTEAQTSFIPRVVEGRHLLLVAPTGIGKTEAAMLPIMSMMVERRRATGDLPRGNHVLYITPLRALNRDMLKRLDAWGEALSIDIGVRHGDTDQAERRRQSLQPPHILITTPETMQIMLLGKRLREGLSEVEWVIIDEIHELTDNERGAQMSIALERLERLSKRGFRRVGLSATVGSQSEVARFLGGSHGDVDIVKVDAIKGMDIRVEAPAPSGKDEAIAEELTTTGDMMAILRRARMLVEDHMSTLFFVNTRDTAEFLTSRYRKWFALEGDVGTGPSTISVHHGSLSREARVEAEEDFKAGRTKGLVCTSSLELGIDIGSADFTIQFNSPRETARLVQRVGRAGHSVGLTSAGVVLAVGPDEIAEAAVIARRAMAGELEPIEVRPGPLAVLANQIIAMSLEADWTQEGMHGLLKGAYAFKDLTARELTDVLLLLRSLHKIWLDEDGTVRRKRSGRDYFFTNISMIPDERTYLVRDITSRGIIGTLDENFVVTYLGEGESFIVKGRSWHIVDISEEEVLVEPSKEEGSIPSWAGEEIPVPFEVAQEVGACRRKGDLDDYPVDERGKHIFADYIAKQKKAHPVPTEKLWTVESGDGIILINACLGSKVNETIARVLSSFLMARFGASVAVTTDAYRIIIEAPASVRPETVMGHLMSMVPRELDHYLRLVMSNSTFIKWHMVQIARKFGALDHDVDVRMININRLIETFGNTPLFEETLAKILWERMDTVRTARVLEDLQAGRIEMFYTGVSPVGTEGLERKRELMSPQRADMQILLAMKARIEKETVKLGCLHCSHVSRRTIGSLPDRIMCPSCGGMSVAAFSPRDPTVDVLKRKVKSKKLTKKEVQAFQRMRKSADVVRGYGRKGVLALAARGVGPDTAFRILRMPYDTEEGFLRRLLAAEVQFARTKRFWD